MSWQGGQNSHIESCKKDPGVGTIPLPQGGSASQVLAKLLHSIEENPEFPVFKENINKIMAIRMDSNQSIHTASRLLLQDIGLTTRILKLVNSVFFKRHKSDIRKITDAVMMLGMENIRKLAMGLLLIERFNQFKNKTLKLLIIYSYLTAFLAEGLNGHSFRLREEDVYITALMFNFGELLAAYYLPREYQEMIHRADQENMTSSQVAQEVFGIPLETLGLAAMKKWNFPSDLISRLAYLYQDNTTGAEYLNQLRQLIKASQILSQYFITLEPIADPGFQEQVHSICTTLELNADELGRSIDEGLTNMRDLAQTLRVDLSDIDFSETLKTLTGNQEGESRPQDVTYQSLNRAENRLDFSPEQILTENVADKKLAALELIYASVRDINQALAAKENFEDLVMMMIESMQQTVGFDRVIFCLVNSYQTMIEALWGSGTGVDDLVPILRAPLTQESNALGRAMVEKKEFLIDVRINPEHQELMEEKYWRQSRAINFIIIPVYLDAIPFGAFYLDRWTSGLPITEEDLSHLKLFRDLIIIALRQNLN
jgi:HD-like signal output (HDOD) protein